jgi:deoxyribodipyrimidine photo-lyase
MPTTILWFRRDLRLSDHPALAAALGRGGAVLPVYIHAPEEEEPWAPGAASRAWLHFSLKALDEALSARGSRLVLRRGPSLEALLELVAESEADAVFWIRRYEPRIIARDTMIKAALRRRDIRAESFSGSLLVEPWTLSTGEGKPYRVFTPFWRAARERLTPESPLPAPSALPAPPRFPQSLSLPELGLLPKPRWDEPFWRLWQPGEPGAQARLREFIEDVLPQYKSSRDRPDQKGTSRLSPHLAFGEISPRQILAAVRASDLGSSVSAAKFLSELGWREFSHHLLYHFPHCAEANLNPRFDAFPWAEPDPASLQRWQQGSTGVPIVDAGMRELWQTGWMHNRVRMLVASFLTKNLRIHWLHGARWFWDTLLDADLANNTQGWQWTAGTGADAAPYIRIFNPVLQAQRFDPEGAYIRRFLPELAGLPKERIHAPWEGMLPRDYPPPMVDLATSRQEALAAFSTIKGRFKDEG